MGTLTAEEAKTIASITLNCDKSDIKEKPVGKDIPGAWFFYAGDTIGGVRVLIDPKGEQLWRPSAYSELRHIKDYKNGNRN